MNLIENIPYRYWCNKCKVEHRGSSGVGGKHFTDPLRDQGLPLKMGDRVIRTGQNNVHGTFIYYPRYNSMNTAWGTVSVREQGVEYGEYSHGYDNWPTSETKKCPIDIDDNGNLV